MPENLHRVVQAANEMPPEIAGVLMAMLMSVLRVIYDNRETKPMRIIMESMICGALSLTVSSAVLALGLNTNWAIFAGGAIGYLGSETVRGFAVKFISKKVDNE